MFQRFNLGYTDTTTGYVFNSEIRFDENINKEDRIEDKKKTLTNIFFSKMFYWIMLLRMQPLDTYVIRKAHIIVVLYCDLYISICYIHCCRKPIYLLPTLVIAICLFMIDDDDDDDSGGVVYLIYEISLSLIK